MSKISEIPINDRPIERLNLIGVQNLSNEELLAILLKTGTKNKSSKELGLEILKHIEDISKLSMFTLEELTKIDGIGLVKASTLIAAIELGKRMNRKFPILKQVKVIDPSIVYEYYKDIIGEKEQEYFYCIYLDNGKKIIKDKLLYIGTLNFSLVHPREIFKEAYKLSAAALICIHNHPSGNVIPSKQDIEMTKRLRKIGELLGIEVCDHVIVSKDKYYSFFENGDIE